MIDEKTPHLKLSLPHADNLLEDDVARLRESLTVLDTKVQLGDERRQQKRQHGTVSPRNRRHFHLLYMLLATSRGAMTP